MFKTVVRNYYIINLNFGVNNDLGTRTTHWYNKTKLHSHYYKHREVDASQNRTSLTDTNNFKRDKYKRIIPLDKTVSATQNTDSAVWRADRGANSKNATSST